METQSCDCTISALFEHAIDLIDPPRWAAADTDPDGIEGDDGDTSNHEVQDDAENEAEPLVKKVKFDDSTCFALRTVTATDALRAYDLLVHAASLSMKWRRNDLIKISWNALQNIIDVYRALLVTSNLLLELLPTDISSASQIIDDNDIKQPCRETASAKCPLMQIVAEHAPVLSSAIEQIILSTARRCILLLQALERICAEKRVAEYKYRGASIDIFSVGGDDIHDYDRNEQDLLSNYDWHDDGHLPLPFCQSKDLKCRSRSSVLHECCYLPVKQDPPCSKYEMNAWTRHWNRGDRLVSMEVEDQVYNEQNHYSGNRSKDMEGDIPLSNISESNHDDSFAFSEGNIRKRKRCTYSSISEQAPLLEDRSGIVKEGFLLLSCDSCGAAPLIDMGETTSTNQKRFIRVYCKLHPSGWLSVEDRSIYSRVAVDTPLTNRRKCMKYIIFSGTTCQPFILDGATSFQFQLDAARYLGSSMLLNPESERKDSTFNDDAVYKLLFAVDIDAGCTFVDGYEWVNALSGAAARAASLCDQIHLEWNGLTR